MTQTASLSAVSSAMSMMGGVEQVVPSIGPHDPALVSDQRVQTQRPISQAWFDRDPRAPDPPPPKPSRRP